MLRRDPGPTSVPDSPVCGNGIVDSEAEPCDDGNDDDDDDGCTSLCTTERDAGAADAPDVSTD